MFKTKDHDAKEVASHHELVLEGALMMAPKKMTLRDEEGWKKTVAANTCDYGIGIVCFAEMWARLMEGCIARGDTVEGCAEEMFLLVDIKGITAFKLWLVVSILSQLWVHGEQLRHWHNSKYGDKGRQAELEGVVFNPANTNIDSK